MAQRDGKRNAQGVRIARRRLASPWRRLGVGVAFVLVGVVASTARTANCRAAESAAAPLFPGATLLAPEVAAALAPASLPSPDLTDVDASPSFAESTTEAASPKPIYRGALVSDFPISPYRKRVFGYAVGAFAEQDEGSLSSKSPGFKTSTWLGGAGQDWNVLDQGAWGFGLQGGKLQIDPKSGSAYDSETTSFAGNVHVSVFGALWRFDALFGMAKGWNNQHSYSLKESNKFSSSQWLLAAEFGARFDKGYTRIEPLVNLQILNLNEPTKANKFASTDSYLSDFADASYRARVGSRFRWERDVALATLKPYIQATWSHEFGSREIYIAGDLSPFPIAYRYGGRKKARDQFDLSGGLGAALRDSLDLDAKYDVKFSKEYVEYMFFVGFNKKY